MAEMTVRVEGTVETTSSGGSSTTTANQGTAATTSGAWPTKITDGTNTAGVTGGTATALLVSSGSTLGFNTLTNATAIADGTTIDFASGKQNITLALIVNGTITGGDVDFQISHDGTNWITVATTQGVGITTGVNKFMTPVNTVSATTAVQFPVARYARGRVIATITGGGSVTATIMAA